MEITTHNQVDEESHIKVVRFLMEYNSSQTGQEMVKQPLEILVRNEEKEILGGLYGHSVWGNLEIKTLAINPNNRKTGIGKLLMKAAEKEATKRNCRFISLDTFSFQAPKFYEKLGFEQVGQETDFPKGFDKFYYRKKV